MRLSAWFRATVAAVLMDQARGEATTTFSAPVRNSEGDSLTCLAQNHTSGSVEVAAVLRDESGAALHSNSLSVAAASSLALTNSSTPVAGAYCEFEFDGDAAAVRGFIRLIDSAGSNTRLLYPASEVRGAARPGVVTYTPPVLSGPDDLVSCAVLNLDSAPVHVAAELRNSIDAVVAGMTLQVDAGEVTSLIGLVDPALSTYCKFTFDGNPAEVRGHVRISGAMGENTRFLALASESHEVSTAVLYTPAVAATGGTVRCAAQNLGEEAVIVNADLLDAEGTVLDEASVLLPPGNVEYMLNTTEEAPVSCRFGFGAQQHGVRTFLAFTEPGGGGTRFLHPATAIGGTAGSDATSFTATVRNVEGSDLECWAQNLGAEPVTVAAALFDQMGSLVDDEQTTIAAGHTVRLLNNTQSLLGAYCRFVFDGSPAAVRGFLVLDDGTARLLETASIARPLTPLPTATRTATATATRTATLTRTPSATASPTPTRTPTLTPTTSPTPTSSSLPSTTGTPSSTPSPTATAAATATSTAPATATASAAGSLTPTASAAPSASPTEAAASVTPTAPETTASPTATAATATATPMASPTTSATPAAPGDANCDGIVSAADLVAVVVSLDSDVVPDCGEDANEDGVVDDADLEEVVALIFGSG